MLIFGGTYILVHILVLVKTENWKGVNFVNMSKYSQFGLEVKTKLLGPPTRTQAWLAEQVREKTGLYVDDAYLSKILTGQRSAPKIVGAIREILNLPDASKMQ